MKTVFCRKYQKDLPKMDRAPFPGEKGEEIFSNVSKQAWMEWLQQQTMLVENFLNNESFDKAEGFVPLDK